MRECQAQPNGAPSTRRIAKLALSAKEGHNAVAVCAGHRYAIRGI